ncbi:protein of unknown function DUF1540 [Syntrophobotulus glycolicus DSM 8271]|uniref:DUF1540 domain-containing protein n=2 Tax=Syntrophobotulus TaxID=51196 RepID=F0T1L7_SYNGF|nr:protein of unknown function DUF1540 [Syntrophobotulus glycolicus DSM 8271]
MVKKMDSPNTGIKCEVSTCRYYSSGDHCTAEIIEVQNKDASTSRDTNCNTFIPRGM